MSVCVLGVIEKEGMKKKKDEANILTLELALPFAVLLLLPSLQRRLPFHWDTCVWCGTYYYYFYCVCVLLMDFRLVFVGVCVCVL